MPKLPAPPMPRYVPRAVQTREMDVLATFLRALDRAYDTWEYAPAEALLAPDVVLRTRAGETTGADAIVRHMKALGQRPLRFTIVAPKGGQTTVNIAELMPDGRRGPERELIFHVRHDKVSQITDLGRTPDMVYRPQSQPN
ncbi:MAG: nuclear transport factor 2 family protein [Dehalococcoidia bacterium]|nr:nuclear transport factor 2 family protein [Dehalococcoidia bacterium]